MTRHLILACGLLALQLPAFAQYKLIGADGSVTYTDRPPANTNAKVSEIGRHGNAPEGAEGPLAALPFALRQVASRFPVTLYTSADCTPCDAGRQLLQQRGVPYTERRVVSEDDAAALQRIVGGRTVPALTIGAQALRGLSRTDWSSYLDAAGYPAQSMLPADWQPPLPTPLVQRAAPLARAAQPAPAAPAPQPAAAPAGDNSGSKIRF